VIIPKLVVQDQQESTQTPNSGITFGTSEFSARPFAVSGGGFKAIELAARLHLYRRLSKVLSQAKYMLQWTGRSSRQYEKESTNDRRSGKD
jgi:hypothetical protein